MDRLSEIRARCEVATPGPWQWSKSKWGVVMIFNAIGRALLGGEEGAKNASFIAHAREDIPYLLEQHAQLTAAIERLHDLIAERNVLLDKYEAGNHWIPVGERLPAASDADKNGNVQIWRGADGCDMCTWDDVPDTWDITHWRPLPEPPKGE